MTTSVAVDAGAVLRQRREALGLTPEQAAAQLNLKAIVIHQLESGEWDQQVAPTFIRGYLRLYVRLLRLENAELLAQLDQQLSAIPATAAMHSFSNKASRDVAENRFMLATYFLLVLLIGLFLVWFWQTHMLNQQPVAVLTADATVQAAEPVKELPALQIRADEALIAASPDAQQAEPANSQLTPEPMASPALSAAETASTDTGIRQPGSVQVDNPVQVAVSQTGTAEASMTVAASSDAIPDSGQPALEPSETVNAPLPAAAESGAALPLAMQFSAQCWVTVTDATGKRLVYRMLQSGESVSLTAVPPLRVVLGDPTAVTVSLNGKAIDLSSYKQGQVVRLTLTGSE